MRTQNWNDNLFELSLDNISTVGSLKTLFEGMKKSFEKERKDLLFNKKTRREEKEYFDFMKFFFSTPDTA